MATNLDEITDKTNKISMEMLEIIKIVIPILTVSHQQVDRNMRIWIQSFS
jgi:hypothetical protein